MIVEHEKSLGIQLLSETVGIPIEIVSNDYEEFPGCEDTVNTYQEIVFQVKEEEPDDWAIGILFTLSLMSFSFAAPKGHHKISTVRIGEESPFGCSVTLDTLKFSTNPGL
jgi:hypothetical protein